MNIFGSSNALIGPIELLFGGASFLAAAMVRKALNDYMDIKFNPFGAMGIGCLVLIISKNFLPYKWAVVLGILGWAVGGFLLSFFMGESSEGDSDLGGNYEE